MESFKLPSIPTPKPNDPGFAPTPGLDPKNDPFYRVLSGELIAEVHEPGGYSGKSDESVTTFVYNFGQGVANTRVVSDPRPGVPPTTYTLNDYGTTLRIDASRTGTGWGAS